MKTKRQDLYVHQQTGEMVQATRAQGRKLPADYKKVEFSINKDGKPTARVRLGTGITMDITENETIEVPQNVNPSAN